MNKILHNSVLYVNLEQLRRNVRTLLGELEGKALIPVLKGNAYGLGLERIGRELAAGNIAADPFWRGPDHNACQWCEYAAACHFEEGRGGDRRRFLPAVRGEEFWQAVAKEQV